MSADYAEFGKYLTQQRELRGLTREEVSQGTRIPLALVLALEEGSLDKLPGRVFVKNYIRAYAEEIGLEPEDTVLRFEEIDPEVSQVSEVSAPAGKRAVRRWPLWLGLLVIAAVAALVGTGHFPLHLHR